VVVEGSGARASSLSREASAVSVLQGVDLGNLGRRRDELAATERTAVLVAVDGQAAGFSPSPTLPATLRRQLYASCTP
jgi:Cu2+-exporting ATPase